MKAQSTVQPKQIEITKIGDRARVRLTDNVEAVEIEDEELFQYDEVLFEMKFRDSLEDSIIADFEIYFNYGIQYMEFQEDLQSKDAEIKRLIDGRDLPVELESLMIGIADSYEELFLETFQNSLAIAELYKLMLGGGN